jgi:dUTP pyrophosphatase
MQVQNSVPVRELTSVQLLHGLILVKVKRLDPKAKLPEYAHVGELGDSAFDVFSNEYIELKPYDMATVHTGIAYQTPPGWALQVFSRSGLTRNHGVTTRGGVIDNGYTGEMVVVLKNEGRETFLIEPGDKIAQVKLERHYEASFEEVAELDATERGANGFGSTGMSERPVCDGCQSGIALTEDGRTHVTRGLVYGPCTKSLQ